jgi:predicted dehydrogenase
VAKTKVAVIGHGHLGKWHAQKADALGDLVAIVESLEANRIAAKEQFPNVVVTDNLESILDIIDAAVVVTPTSTHFDYLKILLSKGKHVFCEKPLCSNLQEAEDVRQYLSEGQVLQVGHSERFHETWEVIEKYQDFIGPDSFIRMNRFAPFKGRATDVDVVQDLMIHDLDLLLYLFKETPKNVSSMGYKIRSDNWDYVCSQFEFESDRRAILVASRNHVKEVRDMEVFSKAGCLYVDLFNNEIRLAPQDQTASGEYIESIEFSKRDHLYLEQEHFYRAIEQKEKAIVTYEDGLQAVRLISKVLESLESGEKVLI